MKAAGTSAATAPSAVVQPAAVLQSTGKLPSRIALNGHVVDLLEDDRIRDADDGRQAGASAARPPNRLAIRDAMPLIPLSATAGSRGFVTPSQRADLKNRGTGCARENRLFPAFPTAQVAAPRHPAPPKSSNPRNCTLPERLRRRGQAWNPRKTSPRAHPVPRFSK